MKYVDYLHKVLIDLFSYMKIKIFEQLNTATLSDQLAAMHKKCMVWYLKVNVIKVTL